MTIKVQGGSRYTTRFTSIPAGEMHVPGLPAGSAGSRGVASSILSSIAAVFAISPDTARILPPSSLSIALSPAPKRSLPQCPASYSADTRQDLLCVGD